MKLSSAFNWILATVLVLMTGYAFEAQARPGHRGPSVSTWDSRASSVVVGSSMLAAEGRVFSAHTYSTNFTSTSGNLSSQFAVHYLNVIGEERVDLLADDGFEPTALHGVSAGAMTLIGRPILDRHDNGLPELGWATYLGASPSVMVGLDRNYVTLPLVWGLGLPYAPAEWVSITPWGEVALAYHLDTLLDPSAVDTALLEGDSPDTSDVIAVLNEALTVDVGGQVSMRAGLAVSAHLGERWDINGGFMMGHFGMDDGKVMAFGGNLGLTLHWDRVVPAVLPAN